MNNCIICNAQFQPHNSRSLTCSKECSKKRKLHRCAEYRKENNIHRVELCKKYYTANKAVISKRKTIYEFNKRNSDLNHRIKCNLRKRLSMALRADRKSGSAIDDLGCSIEEFKKYLSSKFKDNMSWENYGEWHIDHIKPLSSYDLTKKEQAKEACHYSNLQPLWAIENMSKGAKIEN